MKRRASQKIRVAVRVSGANRRVLLKLVRRTRHNQSEVVAEAMNHAADSIGPALRGLLATLSAKATRGR